MIIAYRTWELSRNGRLHPFCAVPDRDEESYAQYHLPVHPTRLPWRPGANEARHWTNVVQSDPETGSLQYELSHGDVPESDCSCGFWAVKTLVDVPYRTFLRPAVGAIAMWGKVVEHEGGYRSQFAAIDFLVSLDSPYVPHGLMQRTAEFYDVPLITVDEDEL